MRKEAEKETKDLREKPSHVFKLVKLMKRDGNLAFTEQDREIRWKEHMQRVMNEENEWNLITDVDVVEGFIEKVTAEEMMTALAQPGGGLRGPVPFMHCCVDNLPFMYCE